MRISDWSSDVCSSDLGLRVSGIIATNTTIARPPELRGAARGEAGGLYGHPPFAASTAVLADLYRLTECRIPMIGVGGAAAGVDVYRQRRGRASLLEHTHGILYGGPARGESEKTDLVHL